MFAALDRWSPYALAVLRIVTALLFLEHGTQKLFGFPAPPEGGTPALFSLFGIGAILELIGSLLLLVGLFTRPGPSSSPARWRSPIGCSTLPRAPIPS